MARKLAGGLPAKANDNARLDALNTFFFDQRGFRGSRGDYTNRSNSYLNEVIDDREGLPITLSILYMELGQRIGLNLAGVGMPGHFVVRRLKTKEKDKEQVPFIDVYDRGAPFDLAEAKRRIAERDVEFREEFIQPIAKKAIIVRMLFNLLHSAREDSDMNAGLRYLDGIVTLDPSAENERYMRSVLNYAKGRKREALDDVNYLLEHFPDRKDRERLLEMKRLLEGETGDE
jgi:serine protease Do